MIRNAVLSLTLLLSLALPLAAQNEPPAGLLDWGKQLTGYCPAETFELTRADVPAPNGFTAWTLAQKSSWKGCGQKLILYSSPTQYLAGRAVPIAVEPRALETRLVEVARRLLGTDARVTVGKAPASGGLRPIRIDFDMRPGRLPMDAWVDPAGEYLIIGVLGTKGTSPAAAQLETLSTGAAVRGKTGAPVVILEISDLQCPGCSMMYQRLEPFLEGLLDKVEYRRVDLPLFEQHDWTLKASSAAKAIQKIAPDIYWDYINFVFKQQPDLNATTIDAAIRQFAETNGIDPLKLEAAVQSPGVRVALLEQVGRAYAHGIFSTPTIIVNGRIVSDAGDGRSVIAYVEKLLSEQ